MLRTALALALVALAPARLGSNPTPRTYCNPVNVDVAYCPIPNFTEQGRHRATADPVIVTYHGAYYLFSTNQWGYWWSPDLAHWTFVPRRFLKNHPELFDELCAPAAWVMDDALYVIGSTYSHDFVIWKSSNPKQDDWHEAAVSKIGGWDPAYFADDDGRLYLYHGSSNAFPLYGTEVDRTTLQAIGEERELIRLHEDIHGWERFGEHSDNTFLKPFLEGAWMNKHGGRYYLQYAAPGTEFSGYADGVYVSDRPLGPFRYQPHNPFSTKPGGFARGAGHGATFQDLNGNYWHVSTLTIAVKNNFERRIGLWPAGFDGDGVMYCNTAYGDYPTYLPTEANADHRRGRFTGWMLLNANKPVTASSTYGAFTPNLAVDENLKTYWSAASGDEGEWFQSDLGAVSTVRAIQVNYADQDAEILGRVPGIHHQYFIESSLDGRKWTRTVDKSGNMADVPHDYIELPTPVEARRLRIVNLHMPTGKFALSGFRVFGNGHGAKPEPVKRFVVLRSPPNGPPNEQGDRRNAWLKWQVSDHATGYVLYAGIAPDKLYTSVMLYGENEYYYKAMDLDRTYYFQIESFNENGLSERTAIVKAE